MKFEIGKFYKAGHQSTNFKYGTKLICIDIVEENQRVYFYALGNAGKGYYEAFNYCQDFQEWKEPREFVASCAFGVISFKPLLGLDNGETIKLREVL